MFGLKTGARIIGIRPEMAIAAIAASRICESLNLDCIITSGTNGVHSHGSLHYAGAALDFRTRDLPAEQIPVFAIRLRSALGEDFDVVVEPDHVHVEFDPKRGL